MAPDCVVLVPPTASTLPNATHPLPNFLLPLQIIPVSPSGVLSEAYNVRIDELNLVDLVFLDAEDFEGLPTIAVLYDDGGGHRHAKTYSLSLPSRVGGRGMGHYLVLSRV